MKWLRSAASYAATAGVLYLLLAYAASFGIRQSIVLALLLASLTWELDRAAPKPLTRFIPYYVLVWPKWQQLLTDFKLISKPDGDWDSIQQSLNEIPPTEHPVLRTGIKFTILQQSGDSRQTLIYWNDRRVFVSEVDFRATMEPVQIGRRPPGLLSGFLKSDVSLFMRWGGEGYNLGICVPDSWWKSVKETCPKPLSEKAVWDCGEVELVLATLPYREFSEYCEPAQWNSRQLSERLTDLQPEREQCLSRFGWKNADERSESAWPESIEHTYFVVEHNSI